MLLKTDEFKLEQRIDTEAKLDRCIKLLEGVDNLESCSLHFKIDDLPSAKLVNLTALIKKQTKLENLILTAEVSKDSCETYALILEKVFIDLSNLRVLTFRGLFSDFTSSALFKLIENTKTLSELSVGACYWGQDCYGMPEEACAPLAKALEQNTSLTHLDLQNNFLRKSGVETIIKNLSTTMPLKVLNLSNNLPPGRYKQCCEGIFELLNRHHGIEEIHTDGFVMTPLKFECILETHEQFVAACIYLSGISNLRHLSLSLSGIQFTPELREHLVETVVKQSQLEKLRLQGISSKEFQKLCERSLIGQLSSLTELELVNLSNLNGDSAYYLIQLIQHNTTLISLSFCPNDNVDCNWINSKDAAELGKVLGQNRHLIHFKLQRTKLDDPEIVAGIIANNSGLQVLDLENNGFSFNSAGVSSILGSLGKNKTLRSLNFCSNFSIFPTKLTEKIYLTEFRILKYPHDSDMPGDWGYHSDHLKNIIQLENYREINQMVDKNKLEPVFQKYLLFRSLLTQAPLNLDLVNFIFSSLFNCSFSSNAQKSMSETIKHSQEQIILEIDLPPPELPININNPPESTAFPFLLTLGASLSTTVGVIIGSVALLAMFGVINLSGAGIAALLTTAGLAVGLGIYGFYKTNCKQEKEPVDVNENSPILMA